MKACWTPRKMEEEMAGRHSRVKFKGPDSRAWKSIVTLPEQLQGQ